ncbi:unnamed protein product [Somion occarium]|uniref:Uncharacterized protein n=1 Tax=Somion occarium TaxID=3059160 RepID=A0ABP1DZI8_9APHY
MDSPVEPGSPVSDSSSDSPPLEETQDALTSAVRSTSAADALNAARMSGAKRRYGGGSHGASSNARDAKSRRREEPGSRKQGGQWEGYSNLQAMGKKEELIDVGLVEHLRNRFGDPFDDRALKEAS